MYAFYNQLILWISNQRVLKKSLINILVLNQERACHKFTKITGVTYEYSSGLMLMECDTAPFCQTA